MRALLACLMIASAVLAGCTTSTPRPDFDAVEQSVEQAYLDHIDGLGGPRQANTRLVAYHNGIDDTGDVEAIPDGGYYTELALHGDRVY